MNIFLLAAALTFHVGSITVNGITFTNATVSISTNDISQAPPPSVERTILLKRRQILFDQYTSCASTVAVLQATLDTAAPTTEQHPFTVTDKSGWMEQRINGPPTWHPPVTHQAMSQPVLVDSPLKTEIARHRETMNKAAKAIAAIDYQLRSVP